MSWEDAAKKYRSHSPSVQELAPLTGRPLSPAPLHSRTVFTQDPQEMDIDASPTQQPGRPPLSDSRIRTPLPSAPRADTRPANMVPVTGADAHKAADLQATVSRILANPSRSRYTAVSALLVHWQDDSDPDAKSAIDELGSVLEQHYNYTFQIISIPAPSDGCKNSWRWLSREVTNFVDNLDNRDVLKIVYYSGHSYLDREREMVLARFVLSFLPPLFMSRAHLWPCLLQLPKRRARFGNSVERHPANPRKCLFRYTDPHGLGILSLVQAGPARRRTGADSRVG